MLASTSSVYGGNTSIPFDEGQKCDTQLSLYAATKKSNEVISHSYSHLFQIPITAFRFFTVYGPWGRPDMALFKFTEAILGGKEIEVYNHGNMKRDFTYIDDLIKAINLLIGKVPTMDANGEKIIGDSLSSIAPWRVVNIGNSKSEKLMTFIRILEKCLNKKARIKYMDMQAGDVPETFAQTDLLLKLIGFKPETDIETGIAQFVEWHKNYRKGATL